MHENDPGGQLGAEPEEEVAETDIPIDAVRLDALTAALGREVHDLRLDGTHLFWGEQDEDVPAVWHWTRYPAREGARLLHRAGEVELLTERLLIDPATAYAVWGAGRAQEDLDALDEVHQVELVWLLDAGLVAADAEIQRRMGHARAEMTRLAMLRADLLRQASGADRGGQARAAEALDVTREAVGQPVATDGRRRDRIMEAVRKSSGELD